MVGPICETGDFLARERKLANVGPGDYLAVCTAGAYGFVLSSNYNSRYLARRRFNGREQPLSRTIRTR